MSDDIREALADQLAVLLYDRGEDVREWPEDEKHVHRNHDPSWSFTQRNEAVKRLQFQKAADAILERFLVVPRDQVTTEYGYRDFRPIRIGSWACIEPLPERGDNQ